MSIYPVYDPGSPLQWLLLSISLEGSREGRGLDERGGSLGGCCLVYLIGKVAEGGR